MSAKRCLPDWMVKSDIKVNKEDQTLKRKPEIDQNQGVRKKCTKRMVHWMNEQELVETALSVLHTDHEEEKKPASGRCVPLNTEMMVIPETDHEETSDSEVSEAAVDIAEQETLPYSKCFEKRRCSSSSESSGEQRSDLSVVLKKDEECKEDSSTSESDHEALQVLREIFFS